VTTSAKTFSMSKPKAGEKVPDWTIAFFRQRNKNRVHSLVVKAMKECGVTQAELARRLGRRPDVVCRWIGAPGNWTLDTVSDLLFAIDGLEVDYKTSDPFDGAKRNFASPEWVKNQSPPLVQHNVKDFKMSVGGADKFGGAQITGVTTVTNPSVKQLESA
jgi:hypothetical protein